MRMKKIMQPSNTLLKWLCKILLLSIFLGGCTHKSKKTQLEEYVARIKSQAGKEIEPLPKVKPYETFTYNDFNLRSPFMPPVPTVLPGQGLSPDVNRRKEALEAFPIDSLQMVGTLERNGKKWALIRDPNGALHRVAKGNYVGQNFGRVDNVTDEKVLITEMISDFNGQWRERNAVIALAESEKSKITGKK